MISIFTRDVSKEDTPSIWIGIQSSQVPNETDASLLLVGPGSGPVMSRKNTEFQVINLLKYSGIKCWSLATMVFVHVSHHKTSVNGGQHWGSRCLSSEPLALVHIITITHIIKEACVTSFPEQV